jgi:hypothetical protein
LDRPSHAETILDDPDLGEGLGVRERRQMCAARNQSRQVQLAVASIACETNTQDTTAGRTHLCDLGNIVVHFAHL